MNHSIANIYTLINVPAVNKVLEDTVTHQKMAQAPVSREWTRDTERFLHFQLFQRLESSRLGLGRTCRSLWISLKTKQLQNTYRAGRCWTSLSQLSILHCSSVSLSLCLSVSLYLPPSLSFAPYFLLLHFPLVSVSSLFLTSV